MIDKHVSILVSGMMSGWWAKFHSDVSIMYIYMRNNMTINSMQLYGQFKYQ